MRQEAPEKEQIERRPCAMDWSCDIESREDNSHERVLVWERDQA